MKQLNYFLAGVGTFLFIAACNSNHSENSNSPGFSVIYCRLGMWDSSVFKRRDSAEMDVKAYYALWHAFTNDTANHPPIEYFTVRATDLLAAMGIDSIHVPGVDTASVKNLYVRVTMGYSQVNHQFKLYVQPVKDANLSGPPEHWNAGTPLYFKHDGSINRNGPGDPIHPGSQPDDSSYVADLNAPCPKTCGSSSMTKQQ